MSDTDRLIEHYVPVVKYHGFNTDTVVTLGGAITAESTLAVTGAVTMASTLAVTGVATFTVGPDFDAAPTGANTLRPIVDSALVGATVALTAAQCGGTFNNRATSGTPSWTLPTAADGLWFTFTVSDVTAGVTITGGTMKFKTAADGTTLSGTTCTNTQGTAVVNDTITFVCDGSVWRMTSQSGIFAAS